MTYATTWQYANDADFQGRCWAALWDIANKVANEDTGYPAAGQAAASSSDDLTYAARIQKDEANLTSRQLAQFVLRNSTISADPANSTDNDIAWEINNAAWAEFRRIG